MPEGAERAISQDDLDNFSQRLEEWGQGLPENEQTLLRVVLAQAKGGVAQADGFALGPDSGLSASAILSPAIVAGLIASKVEDADPKWHEWIRDWDRYADVYDAAVVEEVEERDERG
jgi:hypothetical protein